LVSQQVPGAQRFNCRGRVVKVRRTINGVCEGQSVSEADIREDVRRFLAHHIESVVQLEVLLLLHAHPDRDYSSQQVASELRIDIAGADEQLVRLCAAGLLSCTEQPTPQYRFQPSTPELGETVKALARAYIDRRVTIISLIYSKPVDKIKIFTDAFRIRREKPDDR
jgi:hypothetical protein